MFSPESLFSLESFEHHALFDALSFVWLALSRLEEYLRSVPLGHEGAIAGVYLERPELIFIGEGTVVEPGAFIRGPAVIGRNCCIRHGAYLRGNVLVGDGCVIGHATEVKHSILLNNSRAAHFAFVGDSILGNDVNLGAGVKCANLRLDGECVQLRHKKETVSTGLRKLGALVGDGCQIGCNTVLNPGTVLGKETVCCPNISLGGVIEEKMFVRKKQELLCERER